MTHPAALCSAAGPGLCPKALPGRRIPADKILKAFSPIAAKPSAAAGLSHPAPRPGIKVPLSQIPAHLNPFEPEVSKGLPASGGQGPAGASAASDRASAAPCRAFVRNPRFRPRPSPPLRRRGTPAA